MFNLNLKFKQKMMMIPNIILFFFALILLINILYNKHNQKLNELVSNGFCPAYMITRDMEEQLTSIQLKLQQAVSTSEVDALVEADSARTHFVNLIENVMSNPVLDQNILLQRKTDFITYYEHSRNISEKMIAGDLSTSIIRELGIMSKRYDALKNQLAADRHLFEHDMKKNFTSVQKNNSRSTLFMSITILILMGAVGATAYWISNSVTNNLNLMVTMMKDIAKGEGDLTQRMAVTSSDELGDLANWFNLFIEKLHAIIKQVRTNTMLVSQAVSTISLTASQMAAGSEEHNAQAAEVSASVEEMTASIMQNSQNAGQTAKISEDASRKVKEGAEKMQSTRHGMERIVSASENLENIVKTLTNRALQIGDIIRVIDKIADQTNLLALNAAVEAARAGEQGSGFAVVADEVRKLAERTAEATQEISATIESIQKDTIDASESMMETKDAVDSGREASQQTEAVLASILESVDLAVDMIQQIAAASEEQSAGAQEISNNVEEMNRVSKNTSEGAEQMSAAAENLNSQTEILSTLVNHFKLNTHTNTQGIA